MGHSFTQWNDDGGLAAARFVEKAYGRFRAERLQPLLACRMAAASGEGWSRTSGTAAPCGVGTGLDGTLLRYQA
jgi:hypothetical protein